MNMWLHQESLSSASVRMQELQTRYLSLVGGAGEACILCSHCFMVSGSNLLLTPHPHPTPQSFKNNFGIQTCYFLAPYYPGSLSDIEKASGLNKGKL